ncbi:hypothetical protein BDW72DRAFT_15267 [Aspergillus terricola var. indicus]
MDCWDRGLDRPDLGTPACSDRTPPLFLSSLKSTSLQLIAFIWSAALLNLGLFRASTGRALSEKFTALCRFVDTTQRVVYLSQQRSLQSRSWPSSRVQSQLKFRSR